eukprot:TRINITY_DN778284_c0_g1_i1.p1 TRINITY_DN778284_c0_g1~~TRINITY_DN778284_c0_g1_i1.p1  ORF type:complete len:365 (-),score=125.07 TRINITY_DN778284_c0_g1_i1:169-1263(-)
MDDCRVQFKREREIERTQRLLGDPKATTLGLDVNSLKQQVQERRAQQLLERESKREEAEIMKSTLRSAQELELESQINRAQQHLGLAETWRQQKYTPKPENDLIVNLKKDEIPINHPQVSVSGGQLFDGEDREFTDRTKMHKQMQKQWCDQQVEENDAKKRREMEERRQHAKEIDEMTRMMQEKEQDAAIDRMRRNLDVRDENMFLAMERKRQERENKQREDDYNRRHLETIHRSSLITEDTAQQQSHANPHRLRGDHFKGFSDEQLASIRETQKQQMEELQQKRADERAADREEGRRLSSLVDSATGLMINQLRDTMTNNGDVAMSLKAQQRDARMRMQREKSDRQGLNIESNFFDKFGSTLR